MSHNPRRGSGPPQLPPGQPQPVSHTSSVNPRKVALLLALSVPVRPSLSKVLPFATRPTTPDSDESDETIAAPFSIAELRANPDFIPPQAFVLDPMPLHDHRGGFNDLYYNNPIALRGRWDEMDASLTAFMIQIEELEEENQDLRREMRNLSIADQNAAVEIDQLQQQVAATLRSMRDREARNRDLAVELEGVQDHAEALQARVRTLERDLQQARSRQR
ncbi:hypothetical protein CALVIDRAFT_527373 [Calocera viscosa TUFC12733]|uniref:Uncharacterized protein n=1 Tax=Calocera viscosa (strain TUFC12733) TaxID=1330018 RepID=A0A167MGN2_CALVF|nr:hypothetical protein CALVIDRAFT_527373 [Calocera viscosa TUFC12733]